MGAVGGYRIAAYFLISLRRVINDLSFFVICRNLNFFSAFISYYISLIFVIWILRMRHCNPSTFKHCIEDGLSETISFLIMAHIHEFENGSLSVKKKIKCNLL